MLDQLGLGIRLDLVENVTRNVDPIIRDLNRLQQASKDATSQFNQSARQMMQSQSVYGQQVRYYQDLARAMQGTEVALMGITRGLVTAAQSASLLGTGLNRVQTMGNFSRMYGEISRVQQQMANLGFAMSEMQRHQVNAQAYQALNVQLKDLNDKIKLVKQGIKEMQESPDAHKFVEEIALAKRALQAYEEELKRVNIAQEIAEANGMKLIQGGSKKILITPTETAAQSIAMRLYGNSLRDVALSSDLMYKSLDKTQKMMVGHGYTYAEMKMKATELGMTFQTVGQQLTMYITAPILAATAALGAFASKFEEAQNQFQARTLVSNVNMKAPQGFDNAIGNTWVSTGESFKNISTTMSTLRLSLGNLPATELQRITNLGYSFKQAWGVDAAQSMIKVKSIMKDYGVDESKALDIYSFALHRTNGNVQQANDLIKNNVSELKKQTQAGQEGANAFNRMDDALNQGGMSRFTEGLRAMANVFGVIWRLGLDDALGRIGDSLTKMGNALSNFLSNNPALAKFISYTGIALASILALIAPVMLFTQAMMSAKPIAEGLAASLFGLSRGGLAALSPQALLAAETVGALQVAFARLPQTIGAAGLAIYNFLRMLPIYIARVAMMNPVLAGMGLALIAYANNWGGFKDSINSTWDSIKSSWKNFTDSFKNSELDKMFGVLAKDFKAMWEGFKEGFGFLGTIASQIIYPLNTALLVLQSTIVTIGNGISKLFGGKGDAKNIDELFGTTDKWHAVGKAIGMVVAGFIALRTVASIGKILLSPFVSLNSQLSKVSASLTRIGAQMGTLGRGSGIIGRVTGGVVGAGRAVAGAVLNSAPVRLTRTVVGGTVGAVSTIANRGIISPARTIFNTITNPTGARSAISSSLASMGIGTGLAMARQRAEARRNPARILGSTQNLRRFGNLSESGISNNGRFQGRSVFMSNQGLLSRALIGQRMYTYQSGRDAQGRPTVQRNLVATRGGVLRSALYSNPLTSMFLPNVSPNSLRNRNIPMSMLGGVRRGANWLTRGAVNGVIDRARWSPMGVRAVDTMQRVQGFGRSAVAGANRVTGRVMNRIGQSRIGQGLTRMGGFLNRTLGDAGIRNPFMGALRTSNAEGQMLSPLQRVRNFTRTMATGAMRTGWRATTGTAGFIGRTTMGGARLVGRGVGAVGRGAMRAAAMPFRGASMLMGGAMAALPWVMGAGLIGSAVMNKWGTGADGTKSAKNISGNMDKTTASIAKTGTQDFTKMWNSFKTTGGNILKSTGNLLKTTFHALAPLLPKIGHDAFNGLKSVASAGFHWVMTDGVKILGQFGKWFVSMLPQIVSVIKSFFGSAWNWAKTDGVKLLGELWTWLTGTGIPAAVSAAKSLLSGAWNWIKTDGVKLLGDIWNWLESTGIPAFISGAKSLLSAAWQWIKTDGVKLLGDLWNWLTSVAIPKAVSIAMQLLGAAWQWISTTGVSLLGQFIQWFIGTAVPNMAKTLMDLIGKALGWIVSNGPAILEGLVSGVANIAAKIGTALYNGIADMIGKVVDWGKEKLKDLMPSWAQGLLGGGGGDGSKHATGGIFNKPHVGLVAEDGAEAIIPLSGARRGIGEGLFKQTANILGFNVTKMSSKEKSASESKHSSLHSNAVHLSESQSNSVLALTSGNFKAYAQGGLIDRPHYGLVGEDGEEIIIPLTKRQRALELLEVAKDKLGLSSSKGSLSNTIGNVISSFGISSSRKVSGSNSNISSISNVLGSVFSTNNSEKPISIVNKTSNNNTNNNSSSQVLGTIASHMVEKKTVISKVSSIMETLSNSIKEKSTTIKGIFGGNTSQSVSSLISNLLNHLATSVTSNLTSSSSVFGNSSVMSNFSSSIGKYLTTLVKGGENAEYRSSSVNNALNSHLTTVKNYSDTNSVSESDNSISRIQNAHNSNNNSNQQSTQNVQTFNPIQHALAKRGKTSSEASNSGDTITIEKLEVNFPQSAAGVGEVAARKQAQLMLKEFKKLYREEKARTGRKDFNFDNMLLNL